LLSSVVAAASLVVASSNAAARLNYENPLQAPTKSWYSTITPMRSTGSSFFATNAHSVGVMGFKQVGVGDGTFKGTAVFSISEEGFAAELMECGFYATCRRVGVQGSNAQLEASIDLDEDLSEEESYSFVVQASSVESGVARYDGYFWAKELGGWVLLAKIEAAIGDTPWTLQDMYSFVEQVDVPVHVDTPMDHPASIWGRLGPSFIEPEPSAGQWGQVCAASLVFGSVEGETFPTTPFHANITASGIQWGIGIDGPALARMPQGATLQVSHLQTLPENLDEFVTLRETGQLPTGCAGSTCSAWARFIAFGVGGGEMRVLYLVPTVLLTCSVFYCCGLLALHQCGGPGSEGGSKIQDISKWPLGSAVEAYADSTVATAAWLAEHCQCCCGSSSKGGGSGGKYEPFPTTEPQCAKG